MKQKYDLRKLKVGDEVRTTMGVGVVNDIRYDSFDETYKVGWDEPTTLHGGWFDSDGGYLGHPYYSIQSFRTPRDLTTAVVGSRVTFEDGSKDKVTAIIRGGSSPTQLRFEKTPSRGGWYYNETGVRLGGGLRINKIKPPKKAEAPYVTF